MFGDWLDEHLYNYWVVAVMLIAVGVIFIIVENRNKHSKPVVCRTKDLTWQIAFLIGLFQLVAAVFPGTSRSGGTIIGAILLVGMAVSFLVSVVVIRFLMGYIRKHDFKVFGWYRIVLGAMVLVYFLA